MKLDEVVSGVKKLSGWFEWIGILGAAVLLVVTWVDVGGAKLFNHPLLGSYELVRFSQLITIAFAVAITQVARQHISIDFIVDRLSERPRRVVNCLVSFLLLIFFIAVTVQIFRYGWSMQTVGQLGSTLPIPYYPFIYGLALAFALVCLVFVSEFMQSLTQAIKK